MKIYCRFCPYTSFYDIMTSISPSPFRFFVATILAAFVVGCGTAPPSPPVVYPILAGNWQFNVEVGPVSPGPIVNPILNLSGALSSSGTTVTGTLNVHTGFLPVCVGATADLPATGTVDAAGNLLLSAPVSGGIATLSINVGGSVDRYINGTYQVIGGPCAQSSIGLSAYRVPSATGVYTGTLMPILFNGATAGPSTVTATLTQSATPNADGEYVLSGTVVSTGDCVATFNFSTGLVTGDTFASQPLGFVLPPPTTPNFSGAITPGNGVTTQSMIASMDFPSGCTAQVYTGVLNRQ